MQHTLRYSKYFNKLQLQLYSLTFFISFGISCSRIEQKNKIKHGIITYEITYKNNSGRNFPLQLLPKTMEMKFNQNFSMYKIEDRVGLFSICNIIDRKKLNHNTLIKIFDKKLVFCGNSKESPVFFSDKKNYEIKFLSDTSRLADMLCHKAIITDKTTYQILPVLYSKIVSDKSLNYNTPYEKIDGLLMQFCLQIKNLDMNLTAKKITSKELSDTEFIIPKGYKSITKAQMEEIINTLLP